VFFGLTGSFLRFLQLSAVSVLSAGAGRQVQSGSATRGPDGGREAGLAGCALPLRLVRLVAVLHPGQLLLRPTTSSKHCC